MFLLGLLLGVVWWQLPTILNWSLTQFLEQQGLANVTVEVSDVGLSQSLVKRLDVTYAEPDTELQIQLGQVRLEYSLPDLLTGRAERLFIKSVALKLDHRPSSQVSATPRLPTIEQLLAAYQAIEPSAFPVNDVQLAAISLSHNLASESASTFDAVELQASLSKTENRLDAKFRLGDQQELHWASDVKSGWNVTLFDLSVPAGAPQEAELPHAVFSGFLNQVDQSLVFSADVKPKLAKHMPLFAMFGETSIDVDQLNIAGTLQGNPEATGLEILSTIQSSALQYQGADIETLTGQLDFQITQAPVAREQSKASTTLEVKFDNTVTLTNAEFSDWQVDKLTLGANGNLGLSDGVTEMRSSDVLVTADKLQQAGELTLSNTSFSGSASLTVGAEQWQLGLAEPWQLTSQYARLDDIELPHGLSVRSSGATRVKGRFNSSTQETSQAESENVQANRHGAEVILLEKLLLEVTLPIVQDISIPIGLYQTDATLQISHATFHQDQISLKGDLLVPQLRIVDGLTKPSSEQPSQSHDELNHIKGETKELANWRLANFNQSFELKNDVFTSRGSVDSVDRDLHVKTVTKHNLEQQKGKTDFDFKTVKFNDPQRLNQLISPLVLPTKLVAGEVELSGQARWAHRREQWQMMVDIDTQLVSLGGAHNDTYFSGINAKSSLQVYPNVRSIKPQRLTVEHVDAGVENTDVVVEFTLRPSPLGDLPIVDLVRAQSQLLKGSTSLKPGAYDLNRAQHSLQVVVDNIDLSELVRVQQLDDINATGLVTGALPIVIDNGNISIDNGQLYAIEPGGTLRYQADADALNANQYTETVVLALRNFYYDVLRADTYYQPDGTLLLKLQLQGNNPDFEQGRQVNLNINLEQNVLKLFESLRLVEGVSDTLDKRVQDFYQKTTSQ